MQETIDLLTKNIMELKAMAYDELSEIQRHQNNLGLINQAIDQKAKEETQKEQIA